MGGNAKKNLRMFRALCGENVLKNVCIVTTNWSRVTQEEGDMRERELRESPNLFKPLIDAGAQLNRWHAGAEFASAQSIMDYLIRKDQTKLQIQVELDEGKALEETGAGSVLKEEMIALAEKHKVDMQALQEEIEEATKAKQAELLAELKEERQKTEQQMLKIQEDLNKLKQQQMSVETGFGLQEIEEATKTKQADLPAELEDERKNTQQILNIQEDLNKPKQQQMDVETGFGANGSLVPIRFSTSRRVRVGVTKVVQLLRRGLTYVLSVFMTCFRPST